VILVEDGVLSEADLRRALQVKVAEAIYDLFLWPEGKFDFKDGELPIPPATSPGASPDTSTPGSPVPTNPTDEPQGVVSVLNFYNGGPDTAPAQAIADKNALTAGGVTAKLMHTDDWTLEQPPATRGWLLYVDAPTAEELNGVCDTIRGQFPGAVRDCSQAAPQQATPAA